MNRRLLAAQVVASALVLLVVYLTLFTPDDNGPLLGVKAPGDGGQRHVGAHQPGGRKAGNRAREGGPAGSVFVPASTTPGAIAVVHSPQAPTADQYTDTLSELRARIGSG